MQKINARKIKKLDLILFDFHNTLSNSLFYTGLEKEYPEISYKLSKNIFNNKNKIPILEKWMKGKYTYKEFNRIVAKEIKCKPAILDYHLEKSVKRMSLNKDLIYFAKNMKKRGIKVVIFTDNMDPFKKMVVPNLKLNDTFDNIISSWDYKMLKEEKNGRFVDVILKQMKIEIKKTLLIDDSLGISKIIRNKGGHSYLYKDYNNEFPKFYAWFTKKFL
ncbi:HAD hydrolase-like protein [Candidatus Parcubacteria bacterium]|jgi:FMN phosphatase YigB (HAD superfamily)|nr:HAD hydrolase-like protein [Candidatus Parcubacteria bacterium]